MRRVCQSPVNYAQHQQVHRIGQIRLRTDPETHPGGWAENMVRARAFGGDNGLGALAREVDIEQAIPVEVREFAGGTRKAQAAEPMAAGPDTGELERAVLECLHRGNPASMKQRRPREEQRVEKFRRERHACEPAQAADDELEDHGVVSARCLMFRITRKCTERKMSCVHQSKYQAGRTWREYHVRPISVVVPSPLSRSSNWPRCASR